nr:diguanylate cyclase/phosphodiesterase with PAS/PAC sensors [uncultured bacterium]
MTILLENDNFSGTQLAPMPDKDQELVQALSALKESEARLNAIIKTAVDGIITIDRKGVVQNINPAALSLFQYKEVEVLGNNVSMLMPEPHRGSHDEYMENYHRTGEPKIIGVGRQVWGQRKDGATFPFRLGLAKVTLDSGTIYTGIVHDLSEQLGVQDQLQELNRSLEQKVEERTGELRVANQEMKQLLQKEIELGALKSRFVSMASHEFRTPLGGILSSASLIAKYPAAEDDDKRQKHVGRIKTSVRDLTNILNDFLSLEKLQSGKLSSHLTEFRMEDLFEEVCDDVNSMLAEGQELECSHHGTDVQVKMDRNILKNVLFNLLSNAIKYSAPAGHIKVTTSIDDGILTLEVEDDGIGIPDADQKHLFERFFRGHNAINIKGTGLGLNIVKRYLELLNGDISYISKEGVGTTFTVHAPVYNEL